ncbi:MAG: HAMP domain-containing histidine kinase [Oxalobacteraceae bacterium]|nr:HAMP domain-containing histidine kinase [Oxalobacteraceae bacterium]
MICVVYLVMHAVIWFALSEQRNAQVRLWCLSGLLSGLAVVPLSMRGVVSEWAFIYIGQIPMVLGNAGRCLAVRMFLGNVSAQAKWFYALTSMFFLVTIIGAFEYGVSEYYLQVYYFAFYAVILIDYLLLGYWLKGKKQSLGADLLMAAGIGFSVTLGIRAVGIAVDPGSLDIYANTPDQAIMVMGQMLCIPLTNIGFLRIFLERREEDRLKTERELAAAETRQTLLGKHQQELQHLLQEREEIIRQLTLSNKTAAMGALVASLAHELNQPLCSIRLNTQLVERIISQDSLETDTDDEVKRLVADLNRDNRRAADIIVKLRKLFEDRSGAMVSLDMNDLVRDCAALVHSHAQAKQVELICQLEDGCPVVGDQTQLQQVVLNVLNNAIEAAADSSQAPGLVEVQSICTDTEVILKVSDNGPGISDEMRQSVFELFKTSKAEGMGVGLWLSKTVVNAHLGDIFFESKVGGGTCFEVRLPLNQAQ